MRAALAVVLAREMLMKIPIRSTLVRYVRILCAFSPRKYILSSVTLFTNLSVNALLCVLIAIPF